MSQHNAPTRRPISDWHVETLRLTAFPRPPLSAPHDNDWWTTLIGEPPEAKLIRPKQGLWREEGPFEGGKLSLAVQLQRIDWLFTAADESSPVSHSTEPFSNAIERFSQAMLRWFQCDDLPEIKRLAFGTILSLPVDDRETGYRQIAAYLPHIQLTSENSFDFLYQINRPRDSTSDIPNLKINRLSKWAVAIWRMAELPVNAESPPVVVQQNFTCRLELDVNTAPDFKGELRKEKMPQVFQELVRLGIEILQEGDIP